MAMNEEQVRGALEYYAKKWKEIEPVRLDSEIRAGQDAARGLLGGPFLAHMKWMATTALGFVAEGKIGKANRWLGFIQGALWANGYTGIDEARVINKTGGQPENYEGESE